jgi:hypothetical protein
MKLDAAPPREGPRDSGNARPNDRKPPRREAEPQGNGMMAEAFAKALKK